MKQRDPRRIVSAGTAAVAMILNGLGFTNRRLYLTPQFFESKPIERLLDGNITAQNLDDNALGKALDKISAYGSSRLFGEVAFEIALENNLLGSLAHLDSTSMSVEVEIRINPVMKHAKAGRPKAGTEGNAVGYQMQCEMKRRQDAIEIFLNRKGRFILATNDLDEEKFPDEKILAEDFSNYGRYWDGSIF